MSKIAVLSQYTLQIRLNSIRKKPFRRQRENYYRRDFTLHVALTECDLDKADNAIRPRLLSSKFASDCTRYEVSTKDHHRLC